ncbi:glutaredoxin 3 [Methylocella silvestris BL2]|uniref:Glutaredoxin n=1 Tax=Methylocella silvestris (strain DSM 15510 / CIP 108128 / LMG 27833 / NCIMB 13906 / BL2) TaxID=395965 RepID=B8EJ82_METSB|nr:glutaredoxin 3 [Methylocella silvestris]ACK52574.1 glutaredoxin 3 [Methylocella silvestris BL2]
MAQITIYTTSTCPYCIRAKALLEKKKLEFTEISVDGDPKLRSELAERTGRSSVPQVFIGESHVGGCDDLYELHYDGKLEQLIADHAQ